MLQSPIKGPKIKPILSCVLIGTLMALLNIQLSRDIYVITFDDLLQMLNLAMRPITSS